MAQSGGRVFFAAVVAALMLLAVPLPALAAFAVRIEGPGPYFQQVADGGAGDTFFGVPNIIGAVAVIGSSTLNVNLSVRSAPGDLSSSFLTLGWTLTSTGAAITPDDAVTVTASATHYQFPPSGVGAVLTSNLNGVLPPGATGSVTARQWVDLGNGLFAPIGALSVEHGTFTDPAFVDTKSTNFVSSTFYSIADQVVLTLGTNSVGSGGLASTVVPEPVTMFLGGTGILMLGYAARRRLFGR